MSRYEDFRGRRTFASLDGIRCLSIVAVIWHHSVVGVSWLPGTQRGFLGVDMFFVLSGFLIVTLLLRERDKTGAISMREFYARRALRIFPPYYALLAVLTAYFGLMRPQSPFAAPFFTELPYYLTYTANWVPLHTLLAIAWSLAAEQQFYLLWPPVEKWAAKVAVPLLLAIIAVNQVVNFGLFGPLTLPMLQATFTPICLGVGVAHLLHSREGFRAVERLCRQTIGAPLLFALVVGLANIPAADISGWQRASIQLAMAALLAACVVREDHGLAALLRFPPVARVGVISYGMYLYHPFARHGSEFAVERAALESVPLVLFVGCLALTIAIAEASYRWYETPFLRAKHWLKRGPLRERAADV